MTVKEKIEAQVKEMLEHYDILRERYTRLKAIDMVSMDISLPMYISKKALAEFKTIVKERN